MDGATLLQTLTWEGPFEWDVVACYFKAISLGTSSRKGANSILSNIAPRSNIALHCSQYDCVYFLCYACRRKYRSEATAYNHTYYLYDAPNDVYVLNVYVIIEVTFSACEVKLGVQNI